MYFVKFLIILILVVNLIGEFFFFFLGKDCNKCILNLFSLRIINSNENND